MSIKEELRNTVVTIRTKPYPIKELIPLLNRSSDYIERLEEKISNMEIWEKKYLDRIEELEKENAFLKDWRDTWSPYVNTTKQSEKK
jgi:trans-aconitate methyltransferase